MSDLAGAGYARCGEELAIDSHWELMLLAQQCKAFYCGELFDWC